MHIGTIRKRAQEGNYLSKSHAIIHAIKEGFERRHIIAAVLGGKIIEAYPANERVLICGKAALAKDTDIYLHVVCEYADAVYVEFVTAYIPDEREWEQPPFKRRKK